MNFGFIVSTLSNSISQESFNHFDISINTARFPLPEKDRLIVLLREAGGGKRP